LAQAALQERLSAAESRNFQLEAFAAAAAGPSAGNGASQQQQLSPTADKENSGNGGLRGGSNTAAALAGPSKVGRLHAQAFPMFTDTVSWIA
jgi:hypothetical protein